MGVSILSALGYALALYFLGLEVFYIYIHLPIVHLPIAVDISDGVKEMVESQIRGILFWLAVVSLTYLTLLFCFSALFIVLRSFIGLVTFFRPDLKAAIDEAEREAERKAERKAKNKEKPSKRAIWGRTLLNVFLCTIHITNDAIYNRSKDAASFKEGVLQRFKYMGDKARVIISTEILILFFIFFLGSIISLVRTVVRRHRQQCTVAHANADEESRLTPNEIIMVEAQQNTTTRLPVLEEKLIDLSTGMDAMYEKIESYVVSTGATKKDEEPLIKL
ncbi:hypothetical protein GYMLUDRAFT_245960 [Collybiopsis luxurians FD-317 M1]|uniref:Uncharacterized protein n=1 Tax=Collybiopsis luxurians FD-317 M1 TaxID=944289 RepID=A0A0D0C7V9_9AGAR|nr:hypothetical protein GYMLUDRAFT_245960 [Collybiopsis luxurians FD-317 M1]